MIHLFCFVSKFLIWSDYLWLYSKVSFYQPIAEWFSYIFSCLNGESLHWIWQFLREQLLSNFCSFSLNDILKWWDTNISFQVCRTLKTSTNRAWICSITTCLVCSNPRKQTKNNILVIRSIFLSSSA